MTTEQTLMENLKSATRADHDSAEGHDFQRLLFSGQLPYETFCDYVGQLFVLHKALEDELKVAEKDERVKKVLGDWQFQEGFLTSDLTALGRKSADCKPLAATQKIIDAIKATGEKHPIALLGYHYVLLGSKHGARMICPNLKKAYNLDGPGGTLYFDPYEGKFMQLWGEFKESMNQNQLNEAETAEILDAAKLMFIAMGEIGEGLHANAA
ncbi:MAG: biliverdin-producing heme oxygenase [Candidatus Melainabacteria bacterium]|nr:biliverdin-producing heme oxygenase [Candidatus Melainabacteria bacterium]